MENYKNKIVYNNNITQHYSHRLQFKSLNLSLKFHAMKTFSHLDQNFENYRIFKWIYISCKNSVVVFITTVYKILSHIIYIYLKDSLPC